MRYYGSLVVDGAGRLQAANEKALTSLGIDDFGGVIFNKLFFESVSLGKLQRGVIDSCIATLRSNSIEFALRGVLMNSPAGSIVQISIYNVTQGLSSRTREQATGSLCVNLSKENGNTAPDNIETDTLVNRTLNAADVASRQIDLADYSPQGLVLLSPAFDLLSANRAFFEMTQLQPDEAQGRGWLAALPPEDSQQIVGALAGADWDNCPCVEYECRLLAPLGNRLWVRLNGQRIVNKNLTEADDSYSFVLAISDIDQRKLLDERNEQHANQDSLTGLPNRRSFENALTECILGRSAWKSILAVLFIDLDGFKKVNDTYGHEVGDRLLKKMAQTISKASARAFMVARLGGDEFTVLLTNVRRIEEVKHFASQLNTLLRDNLCIKGVNTEVSASIGVAMHHQRIEDRRSADRIVNDLLRHADHAMYGAKTAGKNCYMFYGSHLQNEYQSRSLQSTDNRIREIHKAINNGDMFIEYQPQVATSTGEIISCEALMRWQHPREGLISPEEFVPFVETHGATGELTIWLIRRICADFRNSLCTYRHASGRGQHLTISVNLSPAQLQNQDILQVFDQIITSEHLPPDRFLFEITERTLIADPVAGQNGIDWLHSRGYRVALDDFGTGYSSLSYLHRFPLDEIKLDGSFISDVETSKASRIIVKSVVELAHALGIRVTAESVEQKSQLHYLSQIGCDQWQGYLMSPSLSPNDFISLVRKRAAPDNVVSSTNSKNRSTLQRSKPIIA